jgi:hypothetical protein
MRFTTKWGFEMKKLVIAIAIVLAASAAAFAQSSGGSSLWGAGMTGSFPQSYYYPPRRLSQPAAVVRGRRAQPARRLPYRGSTPPYRGSFFGGGNR